MYSLNTDNNLYFHTLKYIFFYTIIFLFLALQLSKPNFYNASQNIIFNLTMPSVNFLQNKIIKIETFFSYIKNIDISKNISFYETLERENMLLRNNIVVQERELLKLNELKKISDSGTSKIKNFAICNVLFYLNGAKKMLICSLSGKQNIEIKQNSIVINEFGLVGRVVQNYSAVDNKDNIKIQLINDFSFKIPIVTSKSFTRGIAFGKGYQDEMSINYTDVNNIINNEIAFTSSDGGVIMPDIPVGKVMIDEYGEYILKINNKINNLSFIKIIL